MSFNLYLFNFLHSFAGLYWPLDWLIIFFGTYLGLLLALGGAVFIFRQTSFKRQFSIFCFLTLAVIIAAVFLLLGRLTIESPRPFVVENFTPLISQENIPSFPSGHAIIFTTLAAALWIVHRKTGYWFFIGAFLIDLGRIISGVHFPLDILGGIVLGMLSAYIAYTIFPNKEYLAVKKENSN